MNRKYLSDYFSFTRKERTGIIVIVVLILLFISLPFLFPFFIPSKPVDHGVFEKEIAALKIKQDSTVSGDDKNDIHYYTSSTKKNYSTEGKGQLFYFDPNTLPIPEWKRLGVRDNTITTIQNYLSKGGRFYKPGDIGKIWGLHDDEVKRLLPYVKIERADRSTAPSNAPVYKSYEKPKYNASVIDINTADTTAFIDLPGIGSKLANRIIAFRDKLGGFYRLEQVGETFGLPDSTFLKIRPRLTINTVSLKKININSATIDELKAHPYIRYNLANAITQYRTQHGLFTSTADIKKIMMVTDEVYNKLSAYLLVQ